MANPIVPPMSVEQIVANAVRITVTSVKEFTKPALIKRLVKGNDPIPPGIYDYTFEPFVNDGEASVLGDEMVQRANASGAVSGLQPALYLLENQQLIPAEFQDKKNKLVFAGTEALATSGRSSPRVAAFLRWTGSSWVLGWYELTGSFDGRSLLVRTRKV